MSIENVPESYLDQRQNKLDLFVYDLKMSNETSKSKVNLSMHMFSFLQIGKKHTHFSGTAIVIDKSQSILIKKGNRIWTEILDEEANYYCKLFFFSDKRLSQFLEKYSADNTKSTTEQDPYFTIKNDAYIISYLDSLSMLGNTMNALMDTLLTIKFEELMLYLMKKYGIKFEIFLRSLVVNESSPFTKIVESKIHSNLKLEEIAFLCNMSLSTFKRHFLKEYQATPGKWFQGQRLQKAKEVLAKGEQKPSDIYLEFGYNNLSNFSAAYKTKFGFSPSQTPV